MQNAPENINYLSPTGYRFQCQAFPETQFYCQQAVIPGINISEVEVATPHRPHYVAGDRLNYDAFSITMIIDEYMRNWQEIHEWITGLGKPEGFDQYRKAKLNNQINTTAQLFVLTGSKNPSIRFDFFEIWPKSISSIQFDISAADIAYATADVEFQYNYYEMIRLNPSQK